MELLFDNSIKDVSIALSRNSTLERLSFKSNRIKSLEAFTGNSGLERVYLKGNRIDQLPSTPDVFRFN